jgi:hypothetical protein
LEPIPGVALAARSGALMNREQMLVLRRMQERRAETHFAR